MALKKTPVITTTTITEGAEKIDGMVVMKLGTIIAERQDPGSDYIVTMPDGRMYWNRSAKSVQCHAKEWALSKHPGGGIATMVMVNVEWHESKFISSSPL